MNQNQDQKPGPGSTPTVTTPVASSHPVGTGIGAAGGAVAGAAMGTTVAGPAGAVVGGAIGAATGALTGRSVAQAMNPTAEETYWRGNYSTRDYIEQHRQYADYRPAYRYGWESRARMGTRLYHDVEGDLQRGCCPDRHTYQSQDRASPWRRWT